MNNWKNDKRNLTKKTQAIVDGLGKSFFKEETIQWLGKRPPKERIDLIERIFEKGQEASKSEKYVLIAGLYEILTNHRILPIDPFKQEMVRIPFDVLLTQIEPVLEEKYAYFDELIKQTLTENPVGTEQKTKPVKEPQAENVFKKPGDFWTVRFQGETKHISDCAGFPYIRLLLSQQGKTFTTAEFLSLYNDKPVTLASGDNQLDDEGKENYKKSLADIEYHLQEAKNNNDFGTQEKLEKEKADIMATLTKAAGFGKHGKKLNSEFDKYRLSTGNAIVRAIDKIEKHIPVLAEHLRDAIPNPHSGTSLSYRPSKQINWLL